MPHRPHPPHVREALLARLAAGEPILAILRDPAMPSRRAYARWRATEPAFAAEVARLNAAKREAKIARCRRRLRPFDPSLADRILVRVIQGGHVRAVLAGDPALPSHGVLARWRAERPDFAAELAAAIAFARRARRTSCDPELLEEAWERMLFGATLAALGLQPDMPCRATLYAWMKARPAFRLMVTGALTARHDLLYDQATDICRTSAPSREARQRVDNLVRKAERLAARLLRQGLVEEITTSRRGAGGGD